MDGRLARLSVYWLIAVVWATLSGPPLARAQTERVFFGNLHSHTSYSDGSKKPEDAYKHARDDAHLDFLAVTEHNHIKAENGIKKNDPRKDGVLVAKDHTLYTGPQKNALIPAANRLTEDGTFVALYGQEFSTISSGNHMNVFDVPDVIDVDNGEFGLLVRNWLPAHPDTTGQPAILQFNHPADYSDTDEYGADDFGSKKNWLTEMGAHAALIEILNGPSTTKGEGETPKVMERDYLDYLNLGFYLAPTGDQDNHFETWGTATDARTGVIATALTKRAILDALRARHVYATEDKNLRAIFRVNDHLCGDILAPPPTGSELNVVFTLTDDDEPGADYRVEAFTGKVGGSPDVEKKEVKRLEGDTAAGSVEDVKYTGDFDYVFFKVTQMNEDGDKDRLWTAPVWFQVGGGAAPTAGPPPVTPAAASEPDPAKLVASVNSGVYHVSLACKDAQRIKPSNRVLGPDAKKSRTLHEGCPRQ